MKETEVVDSRGLRILVLTYPTNYATLIVEGFDGHETTVIINRMELIEALSLGERDEN